MHVRCPHCHEPITSLDDTLFEEVDCPSCGGSFSLTADTDTIAYVPPGESTIGHFVLDERLGIGAFGTVWRARDTELDRTVAVKIPRKGQLDAAEAEKFLQEARTAAQLRHPNIVSVHEVGREGDTLYIVSDYVEGLTLGDWLSGQRPSFREAAELCTRIADALHHAHEQGVIHRDLKPGNILLDAAQNPFLTDFGLAKREFGEITLTQEGQILGTPAYMSPEQARGDSHGVDRRADVYSLGVILFELLTGERPFRGNPRMLLHQLVTEDAPGPRRLDPAISRDLETICLKCLERDRERRYATAREVGEELQRYLRGESIHARPVGRLVRTWRWCRRRPAMASALAVGVVAVTALTALSVSLVYQSQLQLARDEAITLAGEKSRLAEIEQANRRLAEGLVVETTKLATQASEARTRAENLSHMAQTALQASQQERGRTEQALETVDRLLFAERMRAADAALTPPEIDVPRARRLLDECPEKFRAWEWRFLKSHMAEHYGALTGHGRRVNGVCFSPDGTRIGSSSLDGTIRVWDVETGRETLVLQAHHGDASGVGFSPDGTRIVGGGKQGTVKVWNVATGDEALDIDVGNRPASIRFSPDGSRITTGGGDGKPVRVWDAATGRETLALEGSETSHDIRFGPDGTRIVAGLADATVGVWDAANGRLVHSLKGHRGRVLGVGFSRDGTRIVSSGQGGTLRVWDATTGLETLVLEIGYSVFGVGIASDGTRIVGGGEDGTVKVWDATTGRELLVMRGHVGPVVDIDLNADGTRIVSGGDDRTVRVWALATDRSSLVFEADPGGVGCVCYSPDGTRIVSGGADGKVRVWEATTGREILSMPGHAGGVSSVFPSADGTRIVSSGADAMIRVWDAATGRETLALDATGGDARGVCFSADGTRIVGGGPNGSVRVWDATTGREVLVVPGRRERVSSVSFSPAGTRILAGEGGPGEPGEVRMWDARTGRRFLTLRGHESFVTSVRFSPDGSRIVSGDRDGVVKLWQVKSGLELHELDGRNSVYDVCFSPDGTRVVSGGGGRRQPGEVMLWDVASGRQTLVLREHAATVTSVCFSPDGTQIASGGLDGTIRVWAAE